MASYVFAAKTFAYAPISDAKTRAFILNALKETAKDINQRFMMIVSTWRRKPRFDRPTIRYAGGDAFIRMSTADKRFLWLDEGTRIRWALLTRDWVSKTTPNSYQSGPGRGYVWLRGKKAILGDESEARIRRGFHVQPGIEARNWTRMLERDATIVLSMRIDDAMAKVAKII